MSQKPNISWEPGNKALSIEATKKALEAQGWPENEIYKVIMELARQVNPPPEIRKAVEDERSMAAEVRRFVESSEGIFCLKNIYDELGISTKNEPLKTQAVRQEVHRLKEEGIIESTKHRHSEYRRVIKELVAMDFVNAPLEEIPLILPFELHKVISILPKDIIAVAGHSGVGKTGILLNTVKMNMDKFDFRYFTNDMGPTGARRRLMKFEGINLED